MRFVALLRGMNIGGNRLSVGDLRDAALGLGWVGVSTYLASGNVIADAEGEASTLAAELRGALAERGLDVPVLVVPGDELLALRDGCPFVPEQDKDVHAFFCWAEPTLDATALQRWSGPNERLDVRGRVAWLHTPDGFGRSPLAPKLHKVLTGTDMTARNLNTVQALAARMKD